MPHNRHKKILLLVFAFILCGCSSTTPIQRADKSESEFGDLIYNGRTAVLRDDIPDSEAYRVFNRGASGFVPLTAVRNSAEERADDFCGRKSQVVEVLRQTTSVGPHVLGNFPRFEIVFACVDQSLLSGEESQMDNYAQLRELKALLDEGVITREEYEREKAEVLAQ